MLENAVKFQKALERLDDEDIGFRDYFIDEKVGPPTHED